MHKIIAALVFLTAAAAAALVACKTTWKWLWPSLVAYSNAVDAAMTMGRSGEVRTVLLASVRFSAALSLAKVALPAIVLARFCPAGSLPDYAAFGPTPRSQRSLQDELCGDARWFVAVGTAAALARGSRGFFDAPLQVQLSKGCKGLALTAFACAVIIYPTHIDALAAHAEAAREVAVSIGSILGVAVLCLALGVCAERAALRHGVKSLTVAPPMSPCHTS